MFAESKQFKRNFKLFIHDKELSAKGSKTERFVHPVLNCLDNPKVAAPHTKTFSMSKKINFVTPNAVCVNVTRTHNLEQLSNTLDLQGCSKIYIFYKQNRVSASCRFRSITFGAKSDNIVETLNQLKTKVAYYREHKEILIIKTA